MTSVDKTVPGSSAEEGVVLVGQCTYQVAVVAAAVVADIAVAVDAV